MNSLKNTNLNLLDAFWTSVYRARGGKAFEHLLINVPMSLKQLDFWRQFIDLMIQGRAEKGAKAGRDLRTYTPHSVGEVWRKKRLV
jgi:hypothetical protein